MEPCILQPMMEPMDRELWSSNGNRLAGTQMVADINAAGIVVMPSQFVNFNGNVYFAAFDGTSWGLWESNGTSAGTILALSFPGTGQSNT